MKNWTTNARRSPYLWPSVIGLTALLVMGVVLWFVFAGGPRQTSSADEKTAAVSSGSGTSLNHDVTDLIGVTSSTVNLVGLTLRINQIEVCNEPELKAYVAVTSEAGDVKQLNSGDVTVSIDGKTIDNPVFEKIDANAQPLTASLVIDRSGSMRGAPIEHAQKAATSFVNQAADGSKIGVVSFDHEVNRQLEPTTNHTRVKDSIRSIDVRGDTALYDAVAQAIENTGGCSRRAIIILSDGGDTASKNVTLAKAIDRANRTGIPVFVVGLKGTTYDEATLKKLASGTGGQLFQTSSPEKLADLYRRIDAQLKGQYYVALKLDIAKTGKEHRLKIVSKVEGSKTSSERSFIY